MMNFNFGTRMGAKYRLINVDTVTGEVTRDSNWFSNMIVNKAVDTMPTGFDALPIPKLGASISAESVTQTGVLTPITTMTCFANKELWAAKYTKESDNAAHVSWGHRYSYRNDSSGSVDVGEIGIDNFNRAVFRDDANKAYAWTISPTESLIVEMEFVIKISGPTAPVNINITDQDGVIIKSLQVNLRVCDKLLDNDVPKWWKVLSKPAKKVYYTIDPNFNGTVRPTANTMKEVSLASDYAYAGRIITMAVKHRGETGGQTLSGLLFHFGCLSPVMTAVFKDPIYVGGGYTFEAKATLTW